MKSVIKVGMDVHKNSFTLAAYCPEEDVIVSIDKIAPTAAAVKAYLENLKDQLKLDIEYECGYEAGCLGYALQRELTKKNIKCVILAPTTMATAPAQKKKKTDSRDAETIARCLACSKSYSAVHVPTPDDEATRDYIRMRDDHQESLKRLKKQILAFCLRKGHQFTAGKTYWTQKHMEWLKKLELSELDRETLDEYLMQLNQLTEKITRLDKRIAELAEGERYADATRKLQCFLGVQAHTALALVCETGDFSRFTDASKFASWLGLVPGECSSGDKKRNTGITKAGNTHLRKLLVEASYAFLHGAVGHKSAALRKRQEGCDPKVIAYADKCNQRLRRKACRMRSKEKSANVIKTACARELACFIWGMMRGKIEAA